MKVLAISDTHNDHLSKKFNKLLLQMIDEHSPDVIIHAGDCSSSKDSFENFCYWYGDLPINYKILVAGNHDMSLSIPSQRSFALKAIKDSGIIYLEDEEVIIDSIKFYGTPWTPMFMNWAFMKNERELEETYSKVPNNTNVLITHGPAYNILDKTVQYSDKYPAKNVGSEALADRIDELSKLGNLKYHVFGHIHEEFGKKERNKVKHLNVSIKDEKYRLVNNPTIFEV